MFIIAVPNTKQAMPGGSLLEVSEREEAGREDDARRNYANIIIETRANDHED